MNRIFIPDGKYTDHALTSVIEHERSHLKQYHLLDILMIEMAIAFQWFNPFVWFYERSLKEIHEYLADDAVLKKGIPQGNYQALLVNEAIGGPVFTMSNQFNQSLIKKRIVMMTKMKTSGKAKLKALLFLPLIAVLLVAFASPQKPDKPRFNFSSGVNKTLPTQEVVVNGKVTEKQSGEPIPGVHVIIAGTTTGTQTDLSGNYSIKAQGNNSVLVFSFVGYKTVQVTAGNKGSFDVSLETEVHTIDFSKKNYMEVPEMKDENKEVSKTAINEPVFVAVEEMPSYPGGTKALQEFINVNLKYPEAAQKAKVEGTVMVNFVITAQGKTKDCKVVRSASPLLNQEALRVVGLFANWNPGKQNGKAVKFTVNVPIEFKLK
jgi:TonB family protein